MHDGPSSYNVARKPLPSTNFTGVSGGGNQGLNRVVPDLDYPLSGQQKVSSQYSGVPHKGSQPSNSTSSQYYHHAMTTTRRTPSTSTTSTSNTNAAPTRTSSTTSSTLGRTASSRSGASITTSSYVALMRKQKATVWCDRAQSEDPRILIQQKAAKERAAREVSGGMQEGRNSTGSMGSTGMRGKIGRHHGTPKATGYNYANPAGGGVPLRLSSTEVGDEGNGFEEVDSLRAGSHQRTNSGRSLRGSNKTLGATNQRQSSRYSQGSLRANGQSNSPNEDIPELEESPYTSDHKQPNSDYFSYPTGQEGSGSSSDFEAGFGEVGQMKGPTASRDIRKAAEDLRRRGSVDERSNTIGGLGGKLYVMNPDPD